MIYIVLFLTGALLCNAVPHLAAGLRGEPFPTPFARPRGVGLSSPVVNVLWGTVNLLAGAFLLAGHPVAIGANGRFAALLAGGLGLGIFLARHFGRVRRRVPPG